jgi:UDP-N-acetyl-2-amino-2-deoxyglucuronate dehydrogenase
MDVVEASARSLGDEYGIPSTTRVEDLLARAGVDLVTIATPAFTHADLAEKAAAAGKHVVCEKPLAPDLPDADRMIAACERAGVALSTCFPYRYIGAVRWLGGLLEAGALGSVIAVRLRSLGEKQESYWTGGFSGRTKTQWRKSRAASGGGVIITNLIHHIDVARAVTGLEVTRAFSETGTFATPVEVEDFGAATLRYENGAIGTVEGSSCFAGGSTGRDVDVLGTKGQVRFGLYNGRAEAFLTEATEGVPAREWTAREFDDDQHVVYYDELAEAIAQGQKPPITGEDGRKALEIVLAIYESAEHGRPVTLPL